ncbi:MAG: cytochrome c oxidase assembly protein [Hymenobacter sp.]
MNSSIWLQWDLNPAALLLVAGLAAAYYWLAGGRWQPRAGFYAGGLVLFLLVELSPLHYLGMHALFSAHMVVHIVVLLLSGPLLVLGLPPARAEGRSVAGRFSRWLGGHVGLAWAAGVGIMWLLHVPAVFDASFNGMHQALSPGRCCTRAGCCWQACCSAGRYSGRCRPTGCTQ